jgi:hypothetical protein
VQTSSVEGITGVALFQLYDVDPAAPANIARLINTSVRTQVGTGGQILIPGLAPFGLTGRLSRLTLTLFAGQESYRTNSLWTASARAAEIADAGQRVGAFPLSPSSADAAFLVTLDPGANTLQFAGLKNATCIALVEVYDVP